VFVFYVEGFAMSLRPIQAVETLNSTIHPLLK